MSDVILIWSHYGVIPAEHHVYSLIRQRINSCCAAEVLWLQKYEPFNSNYDKRDEDLYSEVKKL